MSARPPQTGAPHAAPSVAIAGGGTGGHLYPACAVVEELCAERPGVRLVFLLTGRPIDRRVAATLPGDRVEQPVRPLSGRVADWPRFALDLHRSVRAATALLRSRAVRAVLGTGGYASAPAVLAARRLGIPAAILNPDATPGRANRLLARRVERVFVQWPQTCAHLPPGRAVVSGCPVRRCVRELPDRAAAARQLGLDPQRPVLLVTGASQGAADLNRAVVRAWPEFAARHPDWQLLFLAGQSDEPHVRAALHAPGVRVIGYLDAIELALAAADAVVSRAGASTLAELTATGRPAVLVPYPHDRRRHQYANAQVLAEAGAAELVPQAPDVETTAARLLAALENVADADVRRARELAARRLARPDAARQVAQWLGDAAGRPATGAARQPTWPPSP